MFKQYAIRLTATGTCVICEHTVLLATRQRRRSSHNPQPKLSTPENERLELTGAICCEYLAPWYYTEEWNDWRESSEGGRNPGGFLNPITSRPRYPYAIGVVIMWWFESQSVTIMWDCLNGTTPAPIWIHLQSMNQVDKFRIFPVSSQYLPVIWIV